MRCDQYDDDPKLNDVSRIANDRIGGRGRHIGPAMFLLLVWGFAASPVSLTHWVPDPSFGLWQNGGAAADALPLMPTSLHSAFQLGLLHERVTNTYPRAPVGPLLRQMAEVVSLHREVRLDELDGLGDRILAFTAGDGLWSRVLGFFSFVNLGLTCAALAAVLSFYTCAPVLCASLLPALLVLGRLGLILLTRLFIPSLWLLSATLVVHGGRFPAESGMYVSLIGAALGDGLVIRSVLFNFPEYDKRGQTRDTMWLSYVALTFGPLAVRFGSCLFGWFAILALYGALGFSVSFIGIGWLIGFESEAHLLHVAGTSLSLMVLSALWRLVLRATLQATVVAWMLAPFSTALMTMASVTYFLALLILSNRWSSHLEHWRGSADDLRHSVQVLFVLSLAISAFFGFVWQVESLTNTAIVFAVLFASEKIADRPFWTSEHYKVLAFIGSIGSFLALLYLRTHPRLVAAMFDGTLISSSQ
jgi:hypothetical protein